MSDTQTWKALAARRAVDLVPDGVDVGLGSGTTAEMAIKLLGQRVAEGLRIRGVPTGERTARVAAEAGIPLVTLQEAPELAVTLDGADEVDPHLNLIKGLGGALTREKIVALATLREIILVDDSKLVSTLGEHTPLPVEILPFGWTRTAHELEELGLAPELRQAEASPYLTDNGNYILHLNTGPIVDPRDLDTRIRAVVGVVETGLFLNMTHLVIVGGPNGLREMRIEDVRQSSR